MADVGPGIKFCVCALGDNQCFLKKSVAVTVCCLYSQSFPLNDNMELRDEERWCEHPQENKMVD